MTAENHKLTLKEKTRLRKMLLADKDLRSAAKVIAMFLIDVAPNWNTGIARISSVKIAKNTGLSDATVRKELPEIIARGYIGCIPGGKGAGNTGTYWAIPVPEEETEKTKATTKLREFGEEILGNNSGAIIAELIKACGGDVGKAESVVEFAVGDVNPRSSVEEATRQIREGTYIFA